MDRTSARPMVLVDYAFPGVGFWRDAALVLGGAALMVLCSRLEIPMKPVPITGQTFGVMLVGAVMGTRRGALSMLTYIGLGAIGLPVFAGGLGGLARLVGPTAGYLAGFVPAAALVGWLSERGWDRQPWTTILAMALGMIPVYLLGVAWLTHFVGGPAAIQSGLLPFLPGDALKIALAAMSLPLAWWSLGIRPASRGQQ